jgi:nicotinamide mononucleotide adenylyltransferase
VSNEQVAKDNAECKNEGLKQMQITTFDNMLIEADKNNQVFTNCLLTKGYTWQEKPTSAQLDNRKTINDRYVAAFAKQKTKAESLNNYIVEVCRPKPDAEYVQCLQEEDDEAVAISVFPDLITKQNSLMKEYRAQLMRKEITRKEFKESVDKVITEINKEINERVNKDIISGTYTGKF